MALIQEASEPTMLLENHLFYLPSTLAERWGTRDCDIGPSQATFDDAPDIVFTVAASQNELISLADIRFMCDLVVTKPDSSRITNADAVAPVNNILHSLFQNVTVTVGGRNISDASSLYAVRAYMESLLGFTKEARSTQLSCAGWRADTDLHLPHINGADFRSQGASFLHKALVAHPTLPLSGKLHCDLFQQDKPLLTGVEFTVKLTRSKTAFCFLAASADKLPKVAIRNPRLRIRKYEPTPDFLSAMSKQLLTTTAKYHVERVSMRQLTLLKGQQQAVWPNVVIGQIPKVMIFGLVASDSLMGWYDRNPFNFHHFDLSNISAEVDGQVYPSRGYELDFANNNTLVGYEGLLDCLERLNESNGEIAFDRWEYGVGGYTMYGFDFTPGHTGRGALSLIKQGNLNVNLRFAKPLPEGVVCIAMLVFDNIVEIDNNRQVSFDFVP